MQTRLQVWLITLNPTLIIPNTVSQKPHPIIFLILYWDINANTVIQKRVKEKENGEGFLEQSKHHTYNTHPSILVTSSRVKALLRSLNLSVIT